MNPEPSSRGVGLVGALDPTGGAGLLRDVWTLRDHRTSDGPEPLLGIAVTALTEQGPWCSRSRTFPADPTRFQRQLERLVGARPAALKVGLVPQPLVATLGRALERYEGAVVLDPVLRSSAGASLGSAARDLGSLLARTCVCTPNPDEARALFGSCEPDVIKRHAASSSAVLLKSHALDEGHVEDLLVYGQRIVRFRRVRVEGCDPRGTGCALASAIAFGLGEGRPLLEAVEAGIQWLDRARTHVVTGRDGRPHLALGSPRDRAR